MTKATALRYMRHDPDAAKAKRVTEALLKMIKHDLRALRAAYEQG